MHLLDTKLHLGASGQGRRKESAASLDGGAIKVLPKQKRLSRVRQPLIVMSDMSEHYVFVIDIERSERAGDDGITLCAEVVGIEDDVVAVSVFEALLRFECFA